RLHLQPRSAAHVAVDLVADVREPGVARHRQLERLTFRWRNGAGRTLARFLCGGGTHGKKDHRKCRSEVFHGRLHSERAAGWLLIYPRRRSKVSRFGSVFVAGPALARGGSEVCWPTWSTRRTVSETVKMPW